tara:strand:+ start:222 stop:395 length:174 start_codon:yes stop_codon:yes gene_type:complete
MDDYISKDSLNPINWDGKHDHCEVCDEVLGSLDWENMCSDCFEDMQNNIEDAENLKE